MKNKIDYFLRFLIFSLMFFVLSRACIDEIIFPFAFSMLFALAWANQKVWLLAPAYLIGTVASNPSLECLLCGVVCVGMLIFPYYLHLSLKKNMNKWELYIYMILSQSAWVVFSILNNVWPIFIVATICIGIIYLFLCCTIFEAFILRGFSYKLTLLEMIAGGVILLSFASGLTNCQVYEFSFLKLFVALLLLVISQVAGGGKTLIFASLMGLGSLISDNNPIFVAPFIIWALAVISFKFNNKIYPAIAIIVAEIVAVFYFQLYYAFSIFSILPVFIGAVIFLCLPSRFFNSLSILLAENESRSAVKSLLNRNRDIMQRRLNKLSEVFFDMNVVFRKLIKKEASEQEIKEMLYEELKSTICKGCPEQKHCHRTFGEDTKKIFINLISISLERGRITLLDLPSYLSSRCTQASRLISEINLLTKQYKSYSQLVGNIDESKLLISDQLGGISTLMKTLASEVDTMISMDGGRERKLLDELSANNIICSDAVVYEKDARTFMATLVVREEDINKLKLQSITSKICGNKMAICDVYPTEKAGMVSVNLKTAPRFDCVFGLANTLKSGGSSSGDRYSIERLDGEKFIFAICDGMGSGKEAGEKAETAIGLIENFYKAGFESETILSSVNRLMNLEKDDIFSSVDICIVDLKDGISDFIKMGATSSYIRGEDGCDIIECSALPAGVLDQAKAVTKKVVLKEKDYIVLCSDGVNDAFESDNDFKDFLFTIKGQSPQEYADQILQKALSFNNGYAVDDMTIIVVKII